MAFKLNIGNKSGQGTTGFSLKQMQNIAKSPSMAPHHNGNLKKGGSPFFEIDPETGKERVYGKKTVTKSTEKVDGGTNEYTDTKQDYTDVTAGKSYSDVGVTKEEGKEYWKNNPEARKEYEKGLREPGSDENRETKFTPDPKPTPPKKTIPPTPPPAKTNARLVKNSRKNPDGERGVVTQRKDFKNLTPKQQKSLAARNANNNASNDKRNLKTRAMLLKDRGWTGKTLNEKQKAWVTSTLAKKNKLHKDNASRLTTS